MRSSTNGTIDQIFTSLESNIMFTWSSLSFGVFSMVFVALSAVSSVFILPLLFMSFVFSGLVVIFSGLSYTTFKLASSKYNHTVLLLNKLLRKLADNIPPSVGFPEVEKAEKPSLFSFGFSLPSLNIRDKADGIRSVIKRPFRINSAFRDPPPSVAEEEQDFILETVNLNAKAISDEDEDVEPLPLINGKMSLAEVAMVKDSPVSVENDIEPEQEEQPQQPSMDDQPIKDGEIQS